jgi:hypothetical protein
VLKLGIDVSLTKSLLSTQYLARFESRSKEKKKGSLRAREHFC